MRSLWWALIQYGWNPHKKRKYEHDTGKKDYVKTGKGCPFTVNERDQPHRHIDLRCIGSRSGRKQISVTQATQPMVLCYGSCSKLIWQTNPMAQQFQSKYFQED